MLKRSFVLYAALVAGCNYQVPTLGFVRGQTTVLPMTAPNAVAVADVNGDGRADLIVAEKGTANTMGALFYGQADGSFTAGPVFAETGALLPPSAITLAAGDFLGDGKIEIVLGTVRPTGSQVQLLFRQADGTFGDQQPSDTPDEFSLMAAGDSGDPGKLGLVLYGGLTPALWLGTGQGPGMFVFQKAPSGPDLPDPQLMALGDAQGARQADLIVGTGTEVDVYTGLGRGGFSPVAQTRLLALDARLTALAAADVSGDGRADLVVAHSDATAKSTLSVFVAGTDGTFSTAQGRIDDALEREPGWVAIGDVNGDGKPDLVLMAPGNGALTVDVLLNASQ